MPGSEWSIDRAELLRYLGYRGQELGPELEGQLDRMSKKLLESASPRSVYRIFKLEGTELAGTGVRLLGGDIGRHSSGAEYCAVMGATLGIGADRELFRLQIASVADAVIFNAACTVLIEQAADRCEAEIVRDAKGRGMVTAFRFSPGYGDFPLSQQPDILKLIDGGRRLGISLTDGYLMVPRKSVTAVVPLFPEGTEIKRTRTCGDCVNYASCEFRKNGVICGG